MEQNRIFHPIGPMAGLYLHIPFCEHKCLYCDFYSIAPESSGEGYERLIKGFLASLEREITLRSQDPRLTGGFDTVFFGGGTPSLLSPSDIKNVLTSLSRRFEILPAAEVTLETNPGTVDAGKLKKFRAAGINRLSVGVQSFHEDDLRFLTRIHSADEAKACVNNARAAGFDNVSIDLIFSLPGQTLERWESNLRQAVELKPTHLSCYSLIVEPSTPLARLVETKQVTPLGPEVDNALYQFTIEFLAKNGYEQYEVSNFAQPGYISRHNDHYWHHTNYVGFGPSAHSFWNGTRWWNIANIVNYMHWIDGGRLPLGGEETLTPDQLREEEIYLGLRSSGIDVAGFKKRHNRDLLNEQRSIVDELLRSRLAILDGQKLRLTPKGYSLCDEISLRLS